MSHAPAWWRLLLLLCGIATGMAASASPTVSASLDRNRIDRSESVELTIRSTVRASRDPDLSVLRQDFEILGSAQSSNISIVNGSAETSTEWRFTLLAKRAGTLRVPPIRVGNARTDPLELIVSDSGGSHSGTRDDIQIEVEVDRERVHVQEQLTVLVRVLHAVNFAGGAALEAPEIADAVVRPLGEHSFTQQRGGRQFGVFERRYAVFPQKSGTLLIPPLAFEARVGGGSLFDPFGVRGNVVRLQSEQHLVEVLAPEANASPWLPARVLTLIETWDKSPQELRVGDSATRTLSLTATGLTGAQLPPLPVDSVPGLRFYADKPGVSETVTADGVRGTRSESMAVIATRAGEFELPEMRVRWWDTVNQRFDVALVPRRTIRVLPAAGSSPDPAPATAPPASVPAPAPAAGAAPATAEAPASGNAAAPVMPTGWIIATALLALSTLVAGVQWWRLARRPQHAPAATAEPAAANEAAAFTALRQACTRGDAAALPALILAWARLAARGQRFVALGDVAAQASDAALRTALDALLASRYAAAPVSCDFAALEASLLRLRDHWRQRNGGAAEALPPLYAGRE